jgi:hypothetical protein
MSPVGWRRGRPSCPNGPATGSCRRSGRRWRPRCGGGLSPEQPGAAGGPQPSARAQDRPHVQPRRARRARARNAARVRRPARVRRRDGAAAGGAVRARAPRRRPPRARADRGISDGAVVELGKTDGSRRQVPLSRRALGALDAIPPRLDSPLLFPAPMGGLVNLDNWRRRVWAPAVEAAGVARPARPYDMRATSSATRCMPASRCSRSRRSPARASG